MHISVLRKLWWQILTLVTIFILRIFFRQNPPTPFTKGGRGIISADVIAGKFKNILVIRIDRIGDMLLSTPVFRAIKKKYPESKLTVFASSYNKNVIEGNPYVDEFLVDTGILSSLKHLKNKKFDLAIDLFYGFNLKSVLLCYLCNAEIKLGYKSKSSKHFFNFEVEPVKESQYEALNNLKLLELLGIKTNDIHLDIYPVESIQEKNLNQKKIGINIGTRRKVHRWGCKNFAALADKIIEQFNVEVVITWGPDELNLAKTTLDLMKNKASLAPQTNVRQLALLLKSFDLFICGDTGPFHIAVALDIPIIALFGKSDYIRWAPPSSKIRDLMGNKKDPVLKSKEAVSQSHFVIASDQRERGNLVILTGKRCNEITVDEVFSEVCEVLNAK